MNGRPVLVTGGFDDLRSHHLRFLQEASRFGPVQVLLSPDAALLEQTGRPSRFPFAERKYVLESVRYVTKVLPGALKELNGLPTELESEARLWVDAEGSANSARAACAAERGLEYRVLPATQLAGFPEAEVLPGNPGRKKVVVTGCYDWFHSGHVRFFEEVSAYGDLYVVVGHDANIRLLKGAGHPLLPGEERRYVAGSIRFVKKAMISSGHGWVDADPEIRALKPDIYAVNDDGDKGGKREYCEQMGIEYLVLKRQPAPGLTARSSTDLRGF
jgi:cytidyltransferase-like protein